MNLKIKMIPVQSSNVKLIGYDEENKNIYIELISGEKYIFEDVPKKLFEELLVAKSIGFYINKYLLGSYKKVSQNSFYALEKAAQPLIDYLHKYYNPMTTAIVTENRIDIMDNEMGMIIETKD